VNGFDLLILILPTFTQRKRRAEYRLRRTRGVNAPDDHNSTRLVCNNEGVALGWKNNAPLGYLAAKKSCRAHFDTHVDTTSKSK